MTVLVVASEAEQLVEMIQESIIRPRDLCANG